LTAAVWPSMPGDVHVIRGRQRVTSELGRPLRAPAVAIGNFDGVHLGHQALVATAQRLAHAAGGEAVVLTFDPHPARFFAPKLAPPMLLTLERRLELLAKQAPMWSWSSHSPPTSRPCPRIASSPRYCAGISTPARWWWEGISRSGRPARQRDHAWQRGRAPAHGGQHRGAGGGRGAGLLVDQDPRIRTRRPGGRRRPAARPPLRDQCRVVHGVERGRTLGIPTANLDPEADLVPKPGVYAARACRVDDGPALLLRAP